MQAMLNQLDHEHSEHDRGQPGATERPTRSREQVLKQIKLALVTGAELGILEFDDHRARGSDPYNSRLGAAQRDVWSRRRRA